MNRAYATCQAVLVLALFAGTTLLAPADDTKPSADESDTDRQLLEDLQNDLLEGIELDKPVPKDMPASPSDQLNLPPEDRDDASKPASGGADEDPLAAIGRRMQDVGERLAREDSSEATQAAQRQIVADLKKLIASAQKQQGSGSARGGSTGATTAPKQLSKKPGGLKSAAARAGASVESTERLGKADAKKVDPKKVRQRVEATWGVLPEQVREQMRHTAGDDFLGEYELMIENYFRKLAEHGPHRP